MLELETSLKVKALELENESLSRRNEWADNTAITNSVANASFTSADVTAHASELYAFVNKKTVD